MKLVVDVNLPPKWVDFLGARGIEAVHLPIRRLPDGEGSG